MKKITILMLAFLAVSCIEKNDVRPGSPLDVDIDPVSYTHLTLPTNSRV